MRQAWLALVVVMVAATNAHAIKVPPCRCPARVVLPERSPRDIMGVPTNAKIWVLDTGGDVHRPTRVPPGDMLHVQVIDRERGPHARVHDDALGVDFVTLDQRDDVPPAAPRDVALSLVADKSNHVTTVKLFGRFDADTALVRIDIRDSWGVVSLVTTPDRLFLCDPGVLVFGDSVRVEVRALDLAGNESAPFMATTEIAHSKDVERRCWENVPIDGGNGSPGTRCGEIVVVYGFFYGLFLLCWAAFVAGRAGLVKKYPPEPVSLLVAEGVTIRQLRWYALWATIQVVGAIGLSAAGSEGIAIMLAPFAAATLVRLALAHRVRRLLERPDTTAVRRGRWLVVASVDGAGKLRASNQDFVQAARAGIPRSIAR